jgi:hypothetical protein
MAFKATTPVERKQQGGPLLRFTRLMLGLLHDSHARRVIPLPKLPAPLAGFFRGASRECSLHVCDKLRRLD